MGAGPWHRLLVIGEPPRLVLHVISRRGSRYYLRALSCTISAPSRITTHRLYSAHTGREPHFSDLDDAQDMAEAPSSGAEQYDWWWRPEHPEGSDMPVDDGKWYPADDVRGFDDADERYVVHRGGTARVTVLRQGNRWGVVDRGTIKRSLGSTCTSRAEAFAAAEAYIRDLQ